VVTRSCKQIKVETCERRKYPRFQTKKKVYSSIKYNGEYIIGDVLDISKRGIGLKYLYEMHQIFIKGNGTTYEIEIFSPDEDFLIDGVKGNIVYSRFIPNKSLNIFKMIKCGVKFTDLNNEVVKSIDELIEKTTT